MSFLARSLSKTTVGALARVGGSFVREARRGRIRQAPRMSNATSDGLRNVTGVGNNNATSDGLSSSEGHSMALLIQGYRVTLLVICVTNLVLGIPVVFGMLWHLRVATNASGRGVLRYTGLSCLVK